MRGMIAPTFIVGCFASSTSFAPKSVLFSLQHPCVGQRMFRISLFWGWSGQFRIAQHHHPIPGGRHQIVADLDHLAVLPMVQPKFLEPVKQVSKNLGRR